jgi:hypothetical protein
MRLVGNAVNIVSVNYWECRDKYRAPVSCDALEQPWTGRAGNGNFGLRTPGVKNPSEKLRIRPQLRIVVDGFGSETRRDDTLALPIIDRI